MHASAWVFDARSLYLIVSKNVISFFFALLSVFIPLIKKLLLNSSLGNNRSIFIFFFFKKNICRHKTNLT